MSVRRNSLQLKSEIKQRTLDTGQLTSCLTGLDSAALIMFNQQQIYLLGQIQISQTVGQQYSDTLIPKLVSVLLIE